MTFTIKFICSLPEFVQAARDDDAWVMGRSYLGRVAGHTDNQPFARSHRGSNVALSDARAQEVAQILVAAGVPADRIDPTGKGNAEPAADNATPQGRMRNRRVEITVSE